MSWPPPTLPTDRTNTDLQQNTHPADHNAANLAINDLVARTVASANDFLQGDRTTDDGVPDAQWGNLCSGYSPNMLPGMYLILTQFNWRGNGDGPAYSYVSTTVNGGEVKAQVCAGYTKGSGAITHLIQATHAFSGGPMSLGVRFGFSDMIIYGMAGSSVMAMRMTAL